MALEREPIDISDHPELVRLAEEVRKTQKPLALQKDGRDIAVLTPPKSARKSRARYKRIGPNDPIWDIVGISDADGPTDVSENIDKYLADAYQPRPE
jgi:hypothetical protein